jgi:hypothetical protein
MAFAIPIPDWNSLDSVRHVHSELEGAALLFFALLVIFDVLAHLSEDKKRERALERLALWFFAIAVLAEIIAYPYGQRNDTLSGNMILSLDAKAGEADSKAREAIADSFTALSQAKDALAKAGKAADSLGKAEDEANKAQAASSNALSLADGARKEADSFEKDIASAKKQAAEAESHLAEAMKRANALTAQLDRLTTPRSLPHSPQVIASLKPFKDTEYMFTEVCADTECIDLLYNIESVLQAAGWKRVKSPHRFPGLVLWGDPKGDDGAGIAFKPGTAVSIESTIPDADKKQPEDLPKYISAAIALNSTLASNVSPLEYTGRLVGLESGTSTVVRISVGRKPLP